MALPRPAMAAPARLLRLHLASSTARPTTAVAMPMSMLMPISRRLIASCQQCRLLRQPGRPVLSALVPALSGRPSSASGSFSPSTFSTFSSSSSSSSAPQSHAQPSTSASTSPSREPAPLLTDSQYHDLADDYLDRLLVRLEEMQDAREDVDVEFSSGVLTLSFTGAGSGGADRTYVLNKQPPNKQIWLSSPVSGPKRYDWVPKATGKDGGEDGGEWIYLKDGSSLDSLVKEEIGVDLREPGPDDSL